MVILLKGMDTDRRVTISTVVYTHVASITAHVEHTALHLTHKLSGLEPDALTFRVRSCSKCNNDTIHRLVYAFERHGRDCYINNKMRDTPTTRLCVVDQILRWCTVCNDLTVEIHAFS